MFVNNTKGRFDKRPFYRLLFINSGIIKMSSDEYLRMLIHPMSNAIIALFYHYFLFIHLIYPSNIYNVNSGFKYGVFNIILSREGIIQY